MPALISTTSAHVPRYPPRVPPAPIHRSRPTKNRTTSRPLTSHTNPASPLDGMSPGRILPAHVVEPKWPSPGGRTLVFLHGWPDSPRLWDAQIAHLSEAGHRCVAVPLPGYPPDDAPNRTRGAPRPNFDTAVDDVIATVAALTTARERPFVFVCHDWGCLVGYKLQRRRPELVAALAALDVAADIEGLTPKELAFIVAYQAWLTGALLIGGPIGDAMTAWFARFAGAPEPNAKAALNWPYLAFWREKFAAARPAPARPNNRREEVEKTPRGDRGDGRVPTCPTLFLYGAEKPARFHGNRWLREVRAKGPGSDAVEMPGGHWFLVSHAKEVNERLARWLEEIATLPGNARVRSAL